MGNPKQKWTPEEEAALRRGVDKHGAGKWRTIQKDPEFSGVLATRSNVDLKDKWRNMNVGISGHGSREKAPKSASKHGVTKGPEESGEPSADGSTEVDCSKDKKFLDGRYTELIINSIIDMNDPNGSSTTEIASFVEAHHPVPSNFRRLLSSKLRDMVVQGNLVKIKQNYKVNMADPNLKSEGSAALQARYDRKDIPSGMMRGPGISLQDQNTLEPAKKKFRVGGTARVDVDILKLKYKAVQDAARTAALALAEAEAAAAAAEKAAKEAEDAEIEAEEAQLAVEIAALAVQKSEKVIGGSFSMEVDDVAITVYE